MRRNFVLITSFTILGSFFGLFGCENDSKTSVICKNNPELCVDLHKDSWCLVEKTNLIKRRFDIKSTQTQTDPQLYQLLVGLEQYSKCIELAAGVQHILSTHRTADRERAFVISTQNLLELQAFTKNMQTPLLAFYRWTRFQDYNAMQIALDAYKARLIDDNYVLGQLAEYFVKVDPAEAHNIYRRLFLTVAPEQFNPDWLLAVASIHRQKQNFEFVYLFSKANLIMAGNQADPVQMMGLIQGNKPLAERLDLQAQTLVTHIMLGTLKGSDSESLLN